MRWVGGIVVFVVISLNAGAEGFQGLGNTERASQHRGYANPHYGTAQHAPHFINLARSN